jgi:hypothetical protein
MLGVTFDLAIEEAEISLLCDDWARLLDLTSTGLRESFFEVKESAVLVFGV